MGGIGDFVFVLARQEGVSGSDDCVLLESGFRAFEKQAFSWDLYSKSSTFHAYMQCVRGLRFGIMIMLHLTALKAWEQRTRGNDSCHAW